MDSLHLHLMFAHFPVIGTICGFMLFTTGHLLRIMYFKRAALVLFIFSALSALVVFFSGNGAEELVEKIPGVSESAIEDHEEMASVYIWIISALGLLSIATLVIDYFAPKIERMAYFITIMLSMISMAVSYRVANLGGEIRHTELLQSTSHQPLPGFIDRDEREHSR